MVAIMQELASSYPDLVDFDNAQDKYGLPSPGACGDKRVPCKQYMLTITNKTSLNEFDSLAENSNSNGINDGNSTVHNIYAKSTRPQVFFSGEIHGDERVGPQAMIELALLLVHGASYKEDGKDNKRLYKSDNAWLRYLVNSRVIIIMPMTNAVGYSEFTREENGIDTNRDYPIDNPRRNCMRAVTSKAINEIFREHMFSIALTFHGGMQAIAYEWGTKTHYSHPVSPDDYAQASIASIMSAYAGKFQGSRYPHGRMNNLVYPVNGGMEDWAYATTWDKTSLTGNIEALGCSGYDPAKTKYTTAQLRTINILIETSDDKEPNENTLGTDTAVLLPEGNGDGHVPRNMRLALIAAEFALPYIAWSNPIMPTFTPVCENSNILNANFGWEVGGSVFVDETELVWGKWPKNIKGGQENLEGFGLSDDEITKLEVIGTSLRRSGLTRWAGVKIEDKYNLRRRRTLSDNTAIIPVHGEDINLDGKYSDREKHPIIPQWIECLFLEVDEKLFKPDEDDIELFFMVRAKVDSIWGQGGANIEPNLKPQSHLVNARTNPTWNMKNSGYSINGRTTFYSKPIKIVLKKPRIVQSKPDEKCIKGASNLDLEKNSEFAHLFLNNQESCKGIFHGYSFSKSSTNANSKDQTTSTSSPGISNNDNHSANPPDTPWHLLIFASIILVFSIAGMKGSSSIASATESSSNVSNHEENSRLVSST